MCSICPSLKIWREAGTLTPLTIIFTVKVHVPFSSMTTRELTMDYISSHVLGTQWTAAPALFIVEVRAPSLRGVTELESRGVLLLTRRLQGLTMDGLRLNSLSAVKTIAPVVVVHNPMCRMYALPFEFTFDAIPSSCSVSLSASFFIIASFDVLLLPLIAAVGVEGANLIFSSPWTHGESFCFWSTFADSRLFFFEGGHHFPLPLSIAIVRNRPENYLQENPHLDCAFNIWPDVVWRWPGRPRVERKALEAFGIKIIVWEITYQFNMFEMGGFHRR